MGARRGCQGGAANRVRGQGAEGRDGAGSSQALEGGNGQGERAGAACRKESGAAFPSAGPRKSGMRGRPWRQDWLEEEEEVERQAWRG